MKTTPTQEGLTNLTDPEFKEGGDGVNRFNSPTESNHLVKTVSKKVKSTTAEKKLIKALQTDIINDCKGTKFFLENYPKNQYQESTIVKLPIMGDVEIVTIWDNIQGCYVINVKRKESEIYPDFNTLQSHKNLTTREQFNLYEIFELEISPGTEIDRLISSSNPNTAKECFDKIVELYKNSESKLNSEEYDISKLVDQTINSVNNNYKFKHAVRFYWCNDEQEYVVEGIEGREIATCYLGKYWGKKIQAEFEYFKIATEDHTFNFSNINMDQSIKKRMETDKKRIENIKQQEKLQQDADKNRRKAQRKQNTPEKDTQEFSRELDLGSYTIKIAKEKGVYKIMFSGSKKYEYAKKDKINLLKDKTSAEKLFNQLSEELKLKKLPAKKELIKRFKKTV